MSTDIIRSARAAHLDGIDGWECVLVDAFLYAVGGGTLFEAGTTPNVVQTGVQLPEPNVNLREALQIEIWSNVER